MTSVFVRPVVIAYRKACQPTGTGLSHYVMVINTTLRKDALDKTNVR